jgi:hypothetical protein
VSMTAPERILHGLRVLDDALAQRDAVHIRESVLSLMAESAKCGLRCASSDTAGRSSGIFDGQLWDRHALTHALLQTGDRLDDTCGELQLLLDVAASAAAVVRLFFNTPRAHVEAMDELATALLASGFQGRRRTALFRALRAAASRTKFVGDTTDGEVTHAVLACALGELQPMMAKLRFPASTTGLKTLMSTARALHSTGTPALAPPAPADFTFVGGAPNWVSDAAACMRRHGFCILAASPTAAVDAGGATLSTGLATATLCDECAAASSERLERLQGLCRNLGLDPQYDRLDFAELMQRDAGALRFDLPLLPTDAMLEARSRWAELHAVIDAWAEPVLQASGLLLTDVPAHLPPCPSESACSASSLSDACTLYEVECMHASSPMHACSASSLPPPPPPARVDRSGVLVSRPGASAQHYHRDGSMPGIVNAFMPLVDVDLQHGPTELRTGYASLPDGEWTLPDLFSTPTPVAPTLRKGQLLLFEYRVEHRGLANTSDIPRPVAYRVYAGPGVSDTHNFAATSLEVEACAREAAIAYGGALHGRLVICPARLWPSLPCHEFGGEGWLCRVESVYGPSMDMARVAYVHALDARGVRRQQDYLPLEELLVWRVVLEGDCDREPPEPQMPCVYKLNY